MKHNTLPALTLLLIFVIAISCSDSNSPSSTVLITSIAPDMARRGETAVVRGSGFGMKRGINYVSFAGAKALSYDLWSDTLIRMTIPQDAGSGRVTVYVNGEISKGVDFSVEADPEMYYIQPKVGYINDEITISGVNFGSSQGSSLLYFNDQPISAVSWSNKQIIFKIPQTDKNLSKINAKIDGFTTGEFFLLVGNGGNTSSSLTGLWSSDPILINGINNYCYLYLDESNGKVTGYVIEYVILMTGHAYTTGALTGEFDDSGVKLYLDGSKSNYIAGVLSADKKTINGKLDNHEVRFTKK